MAQKGKWIWREPRGLSCAFLPAMPISRARYDAAMADHNGCREIQKSRHCAGTHLA